MMMMMTTTTETTTTISSRPKASNATICDLDVMLSAMIGILPPGALFPTEHMIMIIGPLVLVRLIAWRSGDVQLVVYGYTLLRGLPGHADISYRLVLLESVTLPKSTAKMCFC
jgi:hypothetical protein